ncbi:hypothetical protein CH063_09903 [Colletotrichum higginsianum]|uniref:Uncharacterized protein n=1 Tax=Colletotrichum higginsianum (strain IMI 349063) TaxID=759273 RepID=H1VFD1_COLHI|nr:hypothetical protein CH063_09903 [Colletotrichum higginsianum]
MSVCRGLWRIRPSQRRLRRRRRGRNSSKLLNSWQPRQPSTDVTSLRSPRHFQMFNFPLGKEGGDWRAGFHQVRTNRRADIELTKRKAIIASRGGYHYDWALFFSSCLLGLKRNFTRTQNRRSCDGTFPSARLDSLICFPSPSALLASVRKGEGESPVFGNDVDPPPAHVFTPSLRPKRKRLIDDERRCHVVET